MIWRAIYYIIMTGYATLIAFILADRFDSFLMNPAVQIVGVCGGFIALHYLWSHRPSEEIDEGEVKPTHTMSAEGK